MSTIPATFLEKIPKTDLHLHLDGSLRIQTLIELAKLKKVELPSFTEEGLNELVFKSNYANLDEYLKGFAFTCAVMQDEEALERVSYELAMDNWAEKVRYIEVRFAPQLHMDKKHSFEQVMKAVDSGLRKARDEINKTIPENEPPFEFGIIVCAMRFFNEYFSEYYKRLAHVLSYSSGRQQIQYASLELARAVSKLKNETDIQVVGFDLAGSEYGYPADNHKKAYDVAHKHFLHKTVHAGEAYGPESIFKAITSLHAERIGHGLLMFDQKMIFSRKIKNKKQYINDLVNYIAERRVTIEVCLTSNLQTVPQIKTLKTHSLKEMLDNRLSVSICTDNRLVSHTTVTRELQIALDNFDISPSMLKNIVLYGFKRSFYYKSYRRKREYVRKVINYYEKIEKEFGIEEQQ